MTVEELQDEICAIDAIYPEICSQLAPQIYEFKIPQHEKLLLQLSFPERYPDEKPEIIQVLIKDYDKYTDSNYIETTLGETLGKVFNEGEVCLFEYFMELEQVLEVYNEQEAVRIKTAQEYEKREQAALEQRIQAQEAADSGAKNLDSHFKSFKVNSGETQLEFDPLKGWSQSVAIDDRGSKFIGYARPVNSVEEAKARLSDLLCDRRIQRASHNMTTWRIKKENGIQYQDCDDDGETAAGSRMLHLLQMMDVWNVIVVVSRWFGGTHIGSDRFKHINSAARAAVINAGLIEESDKKTNKK